jgi:hypothetical protein
VISSEIEGNTQEREKRRKLTVRTERAFPLNAIQDKQYLKHPKKTNIQSTSSFEQYISLQLRIKLDNTLDITILSAPAKSIPTLMRISDELLSVTHKISDPSPSSYEQQ